MLLIAGSAYAQTGSLSITNNNSCPYVVTMYAQSPTNMSTSGCTDIMAIFNIPSGATFTWSDPYDFQFGTSYYTICGSSCTPIGWTTFPSGFGGTVCGTACFGSPNPWSGTYPADWDWTYAIVDASGSCSSCYASGAIGGCGYSSPITGCGPARAVWTSSGASPHNITITIY